MPSTELSNIFSPYPFTQWGIDLLRPFPMAVGQKRFIVNTIDYFTKWVEAKPLATITDQKVADFVWKSIIGMFKVTKNIITDNDKQFDSKKFKTFCIGLSIDLKFSLVAHPQSNDQDELMNIIIIGLKEEFK